MSGNWIRPVDGAGTWRHTARPHVSITDLVLAFLTCLIFLVLLAGLYIAGRHVMCNAYDNQLRNCPGYTPTHVQETAR